MEAALFQVQLDDDHNFDNRIYEFQIKKKDPDPESIHFELLFRDGAMYSSSGRGGLFSGHGLWPGIGTRWINIDEIERHKWEIYPLEISYIEEDQIRRNCERRKPQAYDWLGIFGQPLPGNIQWPWAAYCTEVGNDEICKVKTNILHKRKIRPGEIVSWYKAEGLII